MLSLTLDILIFGGGIWEIIILCKLDTNQKINIIGASLCIVTFLRSINILIVIFYTIFLSFICCLPDSCPCKRLLYNEEIDEEVIELLEARAWNFDFNALPAGLNKLPCCGKCLSTF
jgi:hypothetical protein